MSTRLNALGFTLIELMIAIAIIGVLAAIAIPQFAASRQKAHNAAALSDLYTAKSVVEVYHLEYDYCPW